MYQLKHTMPRLATMPRALPALHMAGRPVFGRPRAGTTDIVQFVSKQVLTFVFITSALNFLHYHFLIRDLSEEKDSASRKKDKDMF
jgi:hypothetical protein